MSDQPYVTVYVIGEDKLVEPVAIPLPAPPANDDLDEAEQWFRARFGIVLGGGDDDDAA